MHIFLVTVLTEKVIANVKTQTLSGTPWTCCWESSGSKDCHHFIVLKNQGKDTFLRSPSHEIKQDKLETYEGTTWERCFPAAPSLNAICRQKFASTHPCTLPQAGRSAAAQQAPPRAGWVVGGWVVICHEGWKAEPPLLASGAVPWEKGAEHAVASSQPCSRCWHQFCLYCSQQQTMLLFSVQSRRISGITEVHAHHSSVKNCHNTRFNVDGGETDKRTSFFSL